MITFQMARYVISELDWMREFIEGVSMEAAESLVVLIAVPVAGCVL